MSPDMFVLKDETLKMHERADPAPVQEETQRQHTELDTCENAPSSNQCTLRCCGWDDTYLRLRLLFIL